jgi:hypothetical protein
MKRTILWLLAIAVAFVTGAAVGGQVVFNGTTRQLLSDALSFDARAVRRYVDVLETMRAEDHEQALELLESWLDDVLIVVMEPANYEMPLRDRAVAVVDTAFLEARAYREAFPRSSSRVPIDGAVTRIWEAGPPSTFP